ncbi:hypothetical protein FQZ97_1001050 [compost metagenome]
MVGNLATAIHLHHRDIAGEQHMLGLAGLPLGEHRIVLEQPDFIVRLRIALGGETLHRVPRRLVRKPAELAEAQNPRLHLQHHVHAPGGTQVVVDVL